MKGSILLTARAVADRLGVSSDTILRWTREGALPAIKLPGGGIRYREDELEAWIEQRATPRREVLPTTPSAARPRTVPSAALPTTDDERN